LEILTELSKTYKLGKIERFIFYYKFTNIWKISGKYIQTLKTQTFAFPSWVLGKIIQILDITKLKKKHWYLFMFFLGKFSHCLNQKKKKNQFAHYTPNGFMEEKIRKNLPYLEEKKLKVTRAKHGFLLVAKTQHEIFKNIYYPPSTIAMQC
jgi:hypothetical protein